MLEEQLIQTAGFRNVGPETARTGFQLRVRSPYYRGLWANLIERPTVIVDGEEFDGRDIRWTLPTGHYTFAALQESADARWPLGKAAVLTVPRDGGLERGIHDVTLVLRLRMSYIPEELQPSIWTATRKSVIVK
ncbi:C-glycoside deglycosidase beta subunit domain-containing protein [Diaminobutyricibacter sp. McL0608]|uniref:C-glycoside deglycosidase beta subunit domain-containing protein n=1 Tax=Leifsonia sp. McL0608 TaxID=3143537 RepID=UPI0031F2F378